MCVRRRIRWVCACVSKCFVCVLLFCMAYFLMRAYVLMRASVCDCLTAWEQTRTASALPHTPLRLFLESWDGKRLVQYTLSGIIQCFPTNCRELDYSWALRGGSWLGLPFAFMIRSDSVLAQVSVLKQPLVHFCRAQFHVFALALGLTRVWRHGLCFHVFC